VIDSLIVSQLPVPETLACRTNPVSLLLIDAAKRRSPSASAAVAHFHDEDRTLETCHHVNLKVPDANIHAEQLATLL
jgi:hypothetical protein